LLTFETGALNSAPATIARALIRLGDGDPLAVAGEFDCQAYKPARTA
jgi:hypothetical protein